MAKTVQSLCRVNCYQLGKVTATSRVQTLLEASKNSNEDTNLYFLDIKIKNNETAGLSAARKIRQVEPDALIAFVTNYAEFALASYEYMTNAFAYVLKTEDESKFVKKINDCLNTYQQQLNSQCPQNYFIYEDRFNSIKLPYNALFYVFTATQHKLGIRTIDQEICFHGTLKQIEAAYPHLLRCHQSYLVNLENVRQIDKTNRQIIFAPELKVPIARKSMKTVQKAWEKLVHQV